jgi:hypothetical protein
MPITESKEFPEPAASAEAPQSADPQVNGEQHSSPEPAPSEPIAAPTAEPPDLETLLREFDDQTQPRPGLLGRPVPEPQPEPQQQVAPEQLPLQNFTAENAALREQYILEADRRDFADFVAHVHDKVPPHVPRHDIENAMFREWATDPAVRAAWEYRGLHREARHELARVEAAYRQLAGNPYADPAQVAGLRERGEWLFCVANSPAILARAERQIVERARKTPLPYDPVLTENRAILSHAVRGASTSTPPEAPAPRFDKMSDRELRQWQEEHLGSSQI